MAARTSSAERSALVESAPATARASDYLQRWKVGFEGTDWVPWLILALAAFLRFFLLGIKPPHFDEGINGWFVDQVMKNGFTVTTQPIITVRFISMCSFCSRHYLAETSGHCERPSCSLVSPLSG